MSSNILARKEINSLGMVTKAMLYSYNRVREAFKWERLALKQWIKCYQYYAPNTDYWLFDMISHF